MSSFANSIARHSNVKCQDNKAAFVEYSKRSMQSISPNTAYTPTPTHFVAMCQTAIKFAGIAQTLKTYVDGERRNMSGSPLDSSSYQSVMAKLADHKAYLPILTNLGFMSKRGQAHSGNPYAQAVCLADMLRMHFATLSRMLKLARPLAMRPSSAATVSGAPSGPPKPKANLNSSRQRPATALRPAKIQSHNHAPSTLPHGTLQTSPHEGYAIMLEAFRRYVYTLRTLGFHFDPNATDCLSPEQRAADLFA